MILDQFLHFAATPHRGGPMKTFKERYEESWQAALKNAGQAPYPITNDILWRMLEASINSWADCDLHAEQKTRVLSWALVAAIAIIFILILV